MFPRHYGRDTKLVILHLVLLYLSSAAAVRCLYKPVRLTKKQVGTCKPQDVSSEIQRANSFILDCGVSDYQYVVPKPCTLTALKKVNIACLKKYGYVCAAWLKVSDWAYDYEGCTGIERTTIEGMPMNRWIKINKNGICPYRFHRSAGPKKPDTKKSERIEIKLLRCPCSKSPRGFKIDAAKVLVTGLVRVAANYARDIKTGVPKKTVAVNVRNTAAQELLKCARRNGLEACINADTALRSQLQLTYCSYDKVTGKNVVVSNGSFITTGMCSSNPNFRSPDTKVSNPGAVSRAVSTFLQASTVADNLQRLRQQRRTKYGASTSSVW